MEIRKALTMLKKERLTEILRLVDENKFVSLHELMKATDSSESTIRADLIELSDAGKIIRLRGGAQSINEKGNSIELSVEAKMTLETPAKKQIGEYASRFIKPNTFIYIDAGTTTFFLLDYIAAPNLKFVTNSVIIARKLTNMGQTVYMIGGEFKATTDAFIGPLATETLNRFNFDMGFFGCNGISKKEGITTPEFEEAMVKKAAMERCKEVYVLADHSKFDEVTAVLFHDYIPSEIITDSVPEEYKGENIKEAKL